eukprot:scaffold50376_cov38-Phaeocystis_antarctica.AAC.2
MPRAAPAAAIGRSWLRRVGRLSLPLPLPSLPLRFVGAFPYPLPHMLIGTCQTAHGSRCSVVAPPVAVSSPPPPSRLRRFPPHANCGLGSSEWSPQILPSHAPRCRGLSSASTASRTPARAVGEGRGARPRATDEQLVGVGKGVCALPSRKEGMRCGAKCVPCRRAGGGGRRWRKQRAGERARLQIRGRALGGAHLEHVAHVRDAGGVEAQQLVERRRVLRRVERRAY